MDETVAADRHVLAASLPATPAAFFEWCLSTVSDADIPFRASYPQYYGKTGEAGYLWRSYDRRLAEVIGLVRPGLRVLEIGCSIASDLHWLALQGAAATGIDVKSEWIEGARKLTAHVRRLLGPVSVDLRRTNLLDLPPEQFDLIYMKDTFHHLEPRAEVVAKIASLLAPGGTIVIVEPNAWNPMIQLKMFRIRGFRTIIRKVDKATGENFVYGNERLVTGGSMGREFSRHGIAGTSRMMRLLPTALTANRFAVGIAEALEWGGVDRWLAPLSIHCIYRGQKR